MTEHAAASITASAAADTAVGGLKHGPLRVGIGGPVGAGKTSLTEASSICDVWHCAMT